jgi:hypothetical protein
MVTRNLLVVRPAVLYIADVPVMWLPFVFQDMRGGRRSGLLTPRFGVAELIRNSPSYRRSIENLGYYFNMGDFADASAWLDWRSGSRGDGFDPGWIRANAETRYRVIDRFLQGRLSASYTANRGGDRNLAISLGHEQSFNQQRRVSANLNYVQNTTVQRQNSINPAAVLGTIASQLNFQDRWAPRRSASAARASSTRGATKSTRTSEPQHHDAHHRGRRELLVDADAGALQLAELPHRPGDAVRVRLRAHGGRALDSTGINPSRRNTSLRLESPLKIFDFNWTNSFSFTEEVQDFPQTRVVYRDLRDTTSRETRVFNQTYLSSLDWNTSFNLPRFLQGSWNVSPTVSLSNVDQGGLFVRSERTGGRWVAQRKRAAVGLSSSPTFYAFPPGFGRVERFRHSVNPVISYSYSPEARVSDDYLNAIGRASQGYLGSLVQSACRCSCRRTSRRSYAGAGRASRRRGRPRGRPATAAPPRPTPRPPRATPPAPPSAPTPGARRSPTGPRSGCCRSTSARSASTSYAPTRWGGSLFNRRGFTDQSFGFSARSDLIPGLDFNTRYSLFLGDPASDTAVFKPYRTETGVTFSLDQNSAIFGSLARLFGRRTQPARRRASRRRRRGAPAGQRAATPSSPGRRWRSRWPARGPATRSSTSRPRRGGRRR